MDIRGLGMGYMAPQHTEGHLPSTHPPCKSIHDRPYIGVLGRHTALIARTVPLGAAYRASYGPNSRYPRPPNRVPADIAVGALLRALSRVCAQV